MLTPELKDYLEILLQKYPESLFEGKETPSEAAILQTDRLSKILTELTNKAKELYGTP